MEAGSLFKSMKSWFLTSVHRWDKFWFTPESPWLLARLRFVFGLFLLYSHLVLASDLDAFIGENAWISQDVGRSLLNRDATSGFYAATYLWDLPTWAIWAHHSFTIAITASWCVGLLTRFTGPLTWFLQLMYLHRLTGALFGFDQIITYAVMYLMLAPAGSCFSVDQWLRSKWLQLGGRSRLIDWLLPDAKPCLSANVATRMLQIHLCVIYLFGGLSKARGVTWWDGTAIWYSISNLEYQSFDMTWLASYPEVISALTMLTLLWELSYAALIWPRITRPVVLLMAVFVHSGIALSLGMATFGFAMIAANACFFRPPQKSYLP